MQVEPQKHKWQQRRGKKQAHWGILTLDDLPNTHGKYSQLIAQLQAQYRADKELYDNQPRQKSEDFSI